jgi:hypothetical protein
MKKLLLTVLFCLISISSFAKNEVFNINNIGIDITAKNSVKAKEMAILEAQKKAFTTLLKRLSMLNDNDILALNISNKEINSILSDFNISEEKSSDVRYTGVFNFSFIPKKSSDFFKAKDISFTSIRSNHVLIIPIWMENEKELLLWEDNNIWKQAWEKFPSDSFLVPTRLPFGDLTDLSQISVNSVISKNISDIASISERYDVKDIVVTVAKKHETGLLILVNRYGVNETSSESSIFIEGENQTYGQILSEAVTQVNNELSALWKEKTITRPDEVNYIDASIEISSIKDLNKIKSLLNEITIIDEFKENLLSVDRVTLDIYYQGSFFDLKLALSQLGVTAEKTDTYSCNLSWE